MTQAETLVPAVRAVPDRDAPVPPTLGQLYAAHRLGLVRLALLLVDDLETAQDVVQDAFVALHARSLLRPAPDAAYAYLRTSVVNGARSALRRR